MAASSTLFSIGKTVLEKLGPLVQQEAALMWNLQGELEKMNGTLTAIQALLLDAEEQQEHSRQVKDWLQKLELLFLDAEDLLDDVATEALREEAAARDRDDSSRCWTVVRFLFSIPGRVIYGLKMAHKVKSLREQLDDIHDDNTKLHLNPRFEERGKMVKHALTISSIPDIVVGREDDLNHIKQLLLLADNGPRISVVSIFGIGGMGKTTLAQLIYNDRQVKEHFKLRIWACVSGLFELRVITTKILESATKEKIPDLEPEALTNLLGGFIGGKKFFLVLDDVWDFNPEEWDMLRSVLKSGASGSKILVTTRFENFAKIMSRGSPDPPYALSGLSSPQSWSLFRQVMSGGGNHQLAVEEPLNISNVEEVKEQIMKKGCFALTHMPVGLGELTRLEVLAYFVVGKEDSFTSKQTVGGLDELHRLDKLRARLEIANLGALQSRAGVLSPSPLLAFELGAAANLMGKPHLETLILGWGLDNGEWEEIGREEVLTGSEEDAEWDESLLEGLQPSSCLKSLEVIQYKGGKCPSWISCLTNLVTLSLYWCKVRHGLHQLQELPVLRKLTIVRLLELEFMDEDEDEEEDGERCWVLAKEGTKHKKTSKPFFPSLQKLGLHNCPKLKGWRRRKLPQFPKLSKLSLMLCPLLTMMPLFPTLEKGLQLVGTSLEPLLCTMNVPSSSVGNTSCSSSFSSEVDLMQYPLSKLKKLQIYGVDDPPRDWLRGMQHLTSLQELRIGIFSGLEETLNWCYISHVPEITLDRIYINRDGQFLWDVLGWDNFHLILQDQGSRTGVAVSYCMLMLNGFLLLPRIQTSVQASSHGVKVEALFYEMGRQQNSPGIETLHGLAKAIVKPWEQRVMAKITINVAWKNTQNDRMTDKLK
ncbi:unnamed protein product [Linum tenue]|uniref:Uncharacterized protein n=1 Tax=Linum tenue TaxID=586396 RepID=A0AAV0HRY1_9ROSI|nr:unnamed protein product [Linum tenue]